MPVLVYQGTHYPVGVGETVLDALLRQGVEIPHSCRNGVCTACLLRRTDGAPPAAAQVGLRESLRTRGFFLACRCRPEGDMRLESARSEQTRHRAVAFATAALGPDIRQVLIEPETPFAYRAGQFVNLRGPDGALRSYSLASLPDTDRYLELHVARVANGRVSAWLHDSLRPGTPLELQGPNGDACYQPGEPDRPLLAIATGTGLAPILGVVRDALEQHGHRGPIRLYHGASHPDRLYCRERLLDLKRRHGNFEYLPCLSRADATDSKPSTPTSEASTRSARACDAALADHPNLSGWRLYVCGNPGMVRTVKRRAYLSGIALADIHGDPFEFATPGTAGREALAPATCR